MLAPWENTCPTFMTIDSDFEELGWQWNAKCQPHGSWKVPTFRQVQHRVSVVKTGETMKDCVFCFRKSFLHCSAYFIFDPVALMMTVTDIWAHGKLHPVLFWVPRWQRLLDLLLWEVPIVPRIPMWSCWPLWRILAYRTDWHLDSAGRSAFPPCTVALSTKEGKCLGLYGIPKNSGTF